MRTSFWASTCAHMADEPHCCAAMWEPQGFKGGSCARRSGRPHARTWRTSPTAARPCGNPRVSRGVHAHVVLGVHMRAHGGRAPLLRGHARRRAHERPPHAPPPVLGVHHHVEHVHRPLAEGTHRPEPLCQGAPVALPPPWECLPQEIPGLLSTTTLSAYIAPCQRARTGLSHGAGGQAHASCMACPASAACMQARMVPHDAGDPPLRHTAHSDSSLACKFHCRKGQAVCQVCLGRSLVRVHACNRAHRSYLWHFRPLLGARRLRI